MKENRTIILLLIALCTFWTGGNSLGSEQLGKFNKKQDLFLAQFDSKTDADDIHSIAGVATMLADPRFDGISYHAVAGAYGMQEGLYIPSNELFKMAFGKHWSDAHADFDKALEEVAAIAVPVLQAGGQIWIAEAGQSDFSAALIRNLKTRLPDTDLKNRIQLVQHGNWNENVTTPEDLAFVKKAASYHKIPDGNVANNGTPGFRRNQVIRW